MAPRMRILKKYPPDRNKHTENKLGLDFISHIKFNFMFKMAITGFSCILVKCCAYKIFCLTYDWKKNWIKAYYPGGQCHLPESLHITLFFSLIKHKYCLASKPSEAF